MCGALAQGGDFGLRGAGFVEQNLCDGLTGIERGGDEMRAVEQRLPAFVPRAGAGGQCVPVAHARVLAGADGRVVIHVERSTVFRLPYYSIRHCIVNHLGNICTTPQYSLLFCRVRAQTPVFVVLSCEDFISAGWVLQAFPGQVTNNVKVNDRAVQRMINK